LPGGQRNADRATAGTGTQGDRGAHPAENRLNQKEITSKFVDQAAFEGLIDPVPTTDYQRYLRTLVDTASLSPDSPAVSVATCQMTRQQDGSEK
jgi:hypothetical protein